MGALALAALFLLAQILAGPAGAPDARLRAVRGGDAAAGVTSQPGHARVDEAPAGGGRRPAESPPAQPVPKDGPGTSPGPSEAAPPYHAVVVSAASWLELDPALIHAIIRAESGYRPHAVSRRGAVGLMQLMPKAGARDGYLRLFGVPRTPKRDALFDPEANIWLGAAYLRSILDRYLRDVPGPARLPLALAAYNWGPANVRRRLRKYGAPSTFDGAVAWIRAYCPPETSRYVHAVLGVRERLLTMRDGVLPVSEAGRADG